jgi:hypothetical protein
LRGKSLKKEDPNNTLKRKRSEEDLANFQRKVAARLEGFYKKKYYKKLSSKIDVIPFFN